MGLLVFSFYPCTNDFNRYHSRFFGQLGHETTYAAIGNHHFFIIKDLFKASIYLDSIYVLALQRSLIMTMTCFSEKMMISYSCIRGFMPNYHKKSLMVSNICVLYPPHVWRIKAFKISFPASLLRCCLIPGVPEQGSLASP